ncbi:MAG TPA: EAL domain-containing protein, partial [Aquihabitans sp.]|nr:EAL domain-containing protein [Aquihabitans sp.]
ATGLQAVRVVATAAPEVPIVVVTGLPPDSLVYAAMAEGADEYVHKGDLEPDRLHDLLVRASQRRVGTRRNGRLWDDAAAVLDTIAAAAVALDGAGRIVAVNHGWAEAAAAGGATAATTGVGVNYLTVCDQAAGAFSDDAAEVAAGIRSVLHGEAERFALDYPCPGEGGVGWRSLRVTPLGELGGGAIVTHLDITELKEAEHRLRSAEPSLASLDEAAPIFSLVDAGGVVQHISDATYELLGLHLRDVVGQRLVDALRGDDPASADAVAGALARLAERPGAQERVVLRTRDAGGRWRDCDLTFTNLLHEPSVRAVTIAGSDITAARLHLIARRLEARLLEGLPMPVLVTDRHGVLVYLNEQAEAMLRCDREEVLGRSTDDLDIGALDVEVWDDVHARLARDGRWEGEYDARRVDGSVVPVRATMERIVDDDIAFDGIVAAWMDLSDRRRLEEEMAFQALHDPLTGLPNRRLFVDHLATALSRSHRTGTQVAVLFLDLDDFKAVNDRVGHVAADEILQTIGGLITAVMRTGDIAARFGGDEFVVCCADLPGPTAALEIADRVLRVLAEPFRVGDQVVTVAASVGVAISTSSVDAEGLVGKADAAMYAAKTGGKGRLEVYDEELNEAVRRRRRLATELDAALEDGSLRAELQPQYDLRTGALVGFEALARWQHPAHGPVPPTEFIPIAEESGRIGPIGRKILTDACEALRSWIDVAPEQVLKVAVNVSPRQLLDASFPDLVARVLADTGAPAGRLCLEITESGLVDPDLAAAALRRLKAIGVEIAIDDFGTGYSSLGRLHRFPLDCLKIDRSFVAGMTERADDEVIISSVLGLAQALGLHVVAEGIEEPEQLERLAAMGCEYGQGYLFGRSLPVDDALALVAAGLPSPHVVPATPAALAMGPPAAGADASLDVESALALLAHELAGPITVLSGWADLLSMSDDPADRETATSAIRRSASAAQAAVELVRDAAASDAGTLQLRRSTVDVAALVGDAVSLVAHALRRPVAVDVPPICVQGDQRRLVAALANLLTNAARHASPDAAVRIVGEVPDGGAALLLHVVDDGPGVPADLAGTIFRRFGRANHAAPGTGLGLYVSRAIARAHGGDLRYQPAPEGGADFVLEIPLAAEGHEGCAGGCGPAA